MEVRVRRFVLVLLCLLVFAAPARAATVAVQGTTLSIAAAPGEANAFEVGEGTGFFGELVLVVDDWGAPLTAGEGCIAGPEPDSVSCPAAEITALDLAAGDEDDSLSLDATLPTRATGGPGDDTLTTTDGADRLEGGAGDDVLSSVGGADVLNGGSGDDTLYGGDGRDSLDGDRGSDRADAGTGADRIRVRDRKADSALCGDGRDRVRAEVLDSLDLSCERVDYGPPGRVGSLLARTGGGRFVPVPGHPGSRVDRRVLPGLLYLIRRYRITVGDCFAMTGHEALGEHPLGLACDIYPGAGGSWNLVDRLARWAEPRQNHPRWPFRWVGYDGDYNHGRSNHLHLSWAHSGGRPGRPVRTVWVWGVRHAGAALASGPLMGPLAEPPAGYPRALGQPDD